MSKKREATGENITTSQNFAARINKIGPTAALVVLSKAFYQNQLNKFRDGETVTLQITNKRQKRTSNQNRYYWGVYLPLIADQTGEKDIERLHELFKGKFLTTGIVEVLGQKVRMKKSTTELSVSDFCQYVIDIETETGIAAPPTENYDLTPLREGAVEKPKL